MYPGYNPQSNERLPSKSKRKILRGATPRALSRPIDGLGIAVVLLLVFTVYAPTLRYQFVHDDRGQIVENPSVHSWHAVPSYFTSQVWAGVSPGDLGNYYRPLFLLWLRMNRVAFGDRPWGWHFTTVLVHLLTTFLAYLLAWRLLSDRTVALLAALIFGLHPAHIEAVAWVSGVTEPLLGALLLGCLLCYIQWVSAGATKWRTLSLVLFCLAILEKETALIFPGLLLVYEWLFRAEAVEKGKGPNSSSAIVAGPLSPAGTGKGSSIAVSHLDAWGIVLWCRGALIVTWPYLFLIALYVPARIYALKGFNHIVTPLSTAQLISTWPSLLAFWIHHLVWPAGLSTFYNFPAVLHATFRNFALPTLVDAAVAFAVYMGARTSRVAAFFAIWLALPLAPLLDIRVFVANDFAHDRYLYLPSVGFAVLIAMLLKKVCVGKPRWFGMAASLWSAAFCLAALMSYAAITEAGYFKDNLTFYSYNLMRAPHNPDAESNYATVLAEDGLYAAALEKFLDVVRRYPNNWRPTYNLALTYYKMGRLTDAEAWLLKATRINPDKSDEYFYLGMTRFKSGRTTEAVPFLHQAIAIRPTGYAYHFALGMMLKTEGDLGAAAQEFRRELANNPGEAEAFAQLREIESHLQDRSARKDK